MFVNYKDKSSSWPLADSPDAGRAAAATREGCNGGAPLRWGVGGVDNMEAGRGENSYPYPGRRPSRRLPSIADCSSLRVLSFSFSHSYGYRYFIYLLTIQVFQKSPEHRRLFLLQRIFSAIKGFLNDMHYINSRFTYLLTYLLQHKLDSFSITTSISTHILSFYYHCWRH